MAITILFSAPTALNVGTDILVKHTTNGWVLTSDNLSDTIIPITPINWFPQQQTVKSMCGKIAAVWHNCHEASVDVDYVAIDQIASLSDQGECVTAANTGADVRPMKLIWPRKRATNTSPRTPPAGTLPLSDDGNTTSTTLLNWTMIPMLST